MKIGVIGFGNLGKSLVKGLIYKNIVDERDIYICARSQNSIDIAINEYNVNASQDVNYILEETDIIFLILKENVFCKLAVNINKELIRNKIVISFMAGVTIDFIREKMGDEIFISRAMPNIAIAQGNGLIGYTDINSSSIQGIFERLGYAFRIEESEIEKITALSACGLGFAAYILNAFVNSGIGLGFSKEISENIILKTFYNAIEIGNFQNTIATVATKGGATEQGIRYLDEKQVGKIINGSIMKAYERVKAD